MMSSGDRLNGPEVLEKVRTEDRNVGVIRI